MTRLVTVASRLALAILGTTVVPATAAWAQVGVRGDVEVGVDIGWTGFRSDQAKPNGSRFSLNGAYFVTRGVAVLADITCLGGTERAPAGSPNFTMCTGSIGGMVDVPVRSRLVPYVRLGVGQSQLDRGAQAGEFDIEERSAALEAGAGARLYFGRGGRVAARLDALWTRNGLFDHWATHASVALGVVYRIAPSR